MNSRGMSLIEVMIAMGVMSVVSAAIISLMINSQKEMRTLRSQQQLLALGTEVQNSVLHSSTCRRFFRIQDGQSTALNLTLAQSVPGQRLSVRLATNEVVNATGDVLTNSYPDLAIQRIFIRNPINAGTTAAGETVRIFNIGVQARDRQGANFRERVVGQVTVNSVGNQMRDCYVLRSGESQNAEAYCEGIGGTMVGDQCETLNAATQCARLGGQMVSGRCDLMNVASLCQSLGGTMSSGACRMPAAVAAAPPPAITPPPVNQCSGPPPITMCYCSGGRGDDGAFMGRCRDGRWVRHSCGTCFNVN